MDKKNEYGQSLFEILFALAIMAMIGVAVVSLSVSAVRNNIYANNKTLANKYNLEGQEWLRRLRDDSFSDLWDHAKPLSVTKTYCLSTLDYPPGNWWNQSDHDCDSQNVDDVIPGTQFTRHLDLKKINLTDAFHNGDENESIKAVFVVEWTDGQGDHDSTTETFLTDWKSQNW